MILAGRLKPPAQILCSRSFDAQHIRLWQQCGKLLVTMLRNESRRYQKERLKKNEAENRLVSYVQKVNSVQSRICNCVGPGGIAGMIRYHGV